MNNKKNKADKLFEISVHLQDSYKQHLGMSNGDPIEYNDMEDKDYNESKALYETLQSIAKKEKAKVKIDHNSFQHKGIHYYDGGIDTTFIQTAIMAFSSAGGAAVFFKLAKDVLLKWMDNASRRSVKLKVDDIEVEIKGSNDVERAFAALEKLEETKNKDKIKKMILSKK